MKTKILNNGDLINAQTKEYLLKFLFEKSTVSIAVLDRNLCYLAASSQWIKDWGLKEEALVGSSHLNSGYSIPRSWVDKYDCCLSGKLDHYKDVEAAFLDKNGITKSIFWEMTSLVNDEGQIEGIIILSNFYTEEKRLEQSLFEEEEIGKVTLESIAHGVVVTDSKGEITYLNPVAKKLTGWSLEDAKHKQIDRVLILVGETDRRTIPNPVCEVLEQETVAYLPSDTILITRQGRELNIEDSAAPIYSHQGEKIGAVLVFRDVTQARKIDKKLNWEANHDCLTELFNRRQLESLLIDVLDNSSKLDSLIYIDLDRFKLINDVHGHQAGDRVLKELGALFKKLVRNSDCVARMGGDEFAMLLFNCSGSKAEQIAANVVKAVAEYRLNWKEKVLQVGASVGVLEIDPRCKSSLNETVQEVDRACYTSKKNGGNRYTTTSVSCNVPNDSNLRPQVIQLLDDALKLKNAPKSDGFCLYMQKIKAISQMQNEFDCYEILIRLKHQGNIIPAIEFISTAERYQLMPEIDRWVINNFIACYEEFHDPEDKNIYTLNLSGASINDLSFGNFVIDALCQSKIHPKNICFEITETVAISQIDRALTLFKRIKEIGCAIALDDFGAGMSSFAYLNHFPLDYLKIDGSFIKDIVNDPLKFATVECFKHISQALEIKTVGEFVEDDRILEQLAKIGIDYAQGYGIEKPRPLSFESALP